MRVGMTFFHAHAAAATVIVVICWRRREVRSSRRMVARSNYLFSVQTEFVIHRFVWFVLAPRDVLAGTHVNVFL